MSRSVVTRFAPSPTGFLHIGGARTALFNWLYAKANNGEMLLRIEDTDRARSSDEAVTAILDGLTWLGIGWSDEPVSQFSRAGRHREIAEQLLSAGDAYRCYSTPAELEAMRQNAKETGSNRVYDGTWRDRDASDWPDDAPYVIRLKVPKSGETIVEDRVQGQIRFKNEDLDDFVLLRSDGSPTYMLAVVADDHDMGVTHVIRGDDHLTNAAKQILIYQALDWHVPVMAHIPLIHGADGAKLSKRHGAIGAEAYRAMGYLPEAMRNYLLRLGWAHGDKEIFSTEEMVALFGFEGMNKSAARFDFDKLDAVNAHYMRAMEPELLFDTLITELPGLTGGKDVFTLLNDKRREWLLAAMPALAERSKTLVELVENASFLFASRPLAMEEKAAQLASGDGSASLKQVLPELEKLEDWTPDGISQTLKAYCEAKGVKLGAVAQPIRAALTGKNTSPGAFDVLFALGKHESINRIKDRL